MSKPKSKKLADYDMIVTAVEEKERITKDDEKETIWKVTAKQEATNDVRLSVKFNHHPEGWFPGLRFQMKLAIDQTVLQEFAEDGDD